MDYYPTDNSESFGHNFIVPISGYELSEIDKRTLGVLKPAGVILMPKNFNKSWDYQKLRQNTLNLISKVKEYSERDKMFISIDHEGGRVHRMSDQLSHFPYAIDYANDAFEVAKIFSRELSSIGVNLNFAPVIDIHSNPDNPVIAERAFGKTADEVLNASFEFLKGLAEYSVLPCIKHFPGHGDTDKDSHHELPTLKQSKEELLNRELVPFKEHINHGIPMIMIAHLLVKQIDDSYPSSFSEKILNNLLRDELQYNGLAISDDLAMKAVSDGLKDETFLPRSMQASMDMFIIAEYHKDRGHLHPLNLAKTLVSGLKTKIISEERCVESFERVEKILALTKNETEALTGDEAEYHRQFLNDLT